ncbi:MAG: hypothetical protein GY713_13335, partial [Actinomycetia bacterium]|nr:hypothetical protein [Actinomycetes bacterium]
MVLAEFALIPQAYSNFLATTGAMVTAAEVSASHDLTIEAVAWYVDQTFTWTPDESEACIFLDNDSVGC